MCRPSSLHFFCATGRETLVRSASSWSEATRCLGGDIFRQRLQSVQENFRKDLLSDSEHGDSTAVPALDAAPLLEDGHNEWYFSSGGTTSLFHIFRTKTLTMLTSQPTTTNGKDNKHDNITAIPKQKPCLSSLVVRRFSSEVQRFH